MNAIMSLVWVDLKLSLRNVIGTFFTFVLPVLMILLFGSMYGNVPNDSAGGLGAMDRAVPGYVVALVIGSAAFLSLPIELVSRRQLGVLRRFRITPLPGWAPLASVVAVHLVVCFGAATLLIGTGAVVWHTRLPSSLPLLGPALLLCAGSQFSIGLLIASALRSTRATIAVGMALFYPMMFLSGGTIPIEYLPRSIQAVTPFLPMSWAVRLLNGVWFGSGLDGRSAGVLAVILIICTAGALSLSRAE
ncbi:MAG: ABC transporter permease [Spirochaetales bacterium]|nr:ABC transporter permease [Spirochaetales bacterium]